MNRQSDNNITVYYQADRFYRVNGQWYYSTREEVNCGPFPTQESAQWNLAEFLAKIKEMASGTI